AGGEPAEAGGRPSRTPTLDEHGRDLTQEARAGRLDVVVGRGGEVEQTVEILSRRTRNNPVLVGEPGVGKTAIVECLAQRIVSDDVPRTLKDTRVVALDLAGLVAGSKYRGESEERLKNVIDEVQGDAESTVLFVDELRTVVGTGSEADGSTDAGNILEPALARGELHVVGATTTDGWRTHVEQDEALERRFQPVLVPEPSVEETVQVLEGLRDSYEARHQVRFGDAALRAAAELSERYVPNRFLPDKAIDLMDTAGAGVRLRARGRSTEVVGREDGLAKLRREKDEAAAAEDFARAGTLQERIAEVEGELAGVEERREGVMSVEPADVADVLSRRTGVPVAQLAESEQERLLKLERGLRDRVVGQEEAVTAVSEAVRRNRAGAGDPDRPLGSFLFLGPTGVGKTELAKGLAELLFADGSGLVRFDMGEFQEKYTVARLVGAPPGHVGHEGAGQLTEKVRGQPHGVVLFDEVEKAHPDVFDTLRQVLDGRLTDAQGRTVDFRRTVVVVTSNLGSQLLLAHHDETGDRLFEELDSRFPSEFLNRVDETVVFRALDEEDLACIVDRMLELSRRRLRAQEIVLEVTDAAKRTLVAHGHRPESGARPLRRAVRTELDNRVASMLLADEAVAGDTVVVDAEDGELTLSAGRPRLSAGAVREKGDRRTARQAPDTPGKAGR
ncbi:ATP-dependent Clp protease ATP-binding subunit, partial [Streptomyces xiaopingdaonensis]|uniref:ATP-dependent Clp protease ATP-binding subunit n=1 Tax=Streptomyces xiaopingdaonensis TaxID=1565415 RepID=UPI00035E6332